MPYNNLISRTDAAALIPEEVSNAILGNLQNESAAFELFNRVTMPTNQTRMPVISALPTAYFVNGDTGQKQTTEANWANKYLDAEELAAIVPIPEAVLDDSSYDIWGQTRPLLEQAVGRAIDAAVFFGTNKPASWANAIVTDAATAGNTVTRGTAAAAAGGLATDISNVWGTVEADGHDVNGAIAIRTFRARVRNTRDTTGQRLAELGDNGDTINGVRTIYPMRGLWPTATGSAEYIAGDFSQAILGVRQDFRYKVLTEAVIQDNTGAIIYNLAQQDMVALRITFRCAFETANTLNYDQPTDASRYPFGVLLVP